MIGNSSALTVLALIFITLKLTGNISWSWLWVLSPLWGGVLAIPIVLIALFFLAVYQTSKSKQKVKK
jgi:hypothetical protein